MTLAKYQEYSAARADGLPLPSHWRTPPLYLRYSIELGKMLDTSRIAGNCLTPYLRNVDVQWDRINLAELPEMDISPHEVARYTVQSGDLLVCEGGEVGRAAVVGDLLRPIGFQKALHRLRPLRADESPRFLYYVFRWAVESGAFANQGQSTIAHLTGEQLRKCRFPCPPADEQCEIAAFLDHETAKIDGLIAEQEKLIALLAEKRQATISHAVTRGLNPQAPMKDSGVPWLGEVPAHWRVGKAGFYVSVLPGYAFPSNGFSLDEGDTRLLRGINVGVGELRWDEVVYWRRAENDGLDAFELQAGDIVIGMDRPLISTGMRVATVSEDDLPCLLLQRVAKIQPGPEMDARFIMRLLGSRAFEAHFAPETTGVSVPHISGEQITGFVIPVAPMDEQREICDFLDGELGRLAGLQTEAARAVDLLRERRSALIAAAVTGQIDVRGFTAA